MLRIPKMEVVSYIKWKCSMAISSDKSNISWGARQRKTASVVLSILRVVRFTRQSSVDIKAQDTMQ